MDVRMETGKFTVWLVFFIMVYLTPTSHSLPETRSSALQRRLDTIEKNINSLNNAMSKLVYTLLENKAKNSHEIIKRDVSGDDADDLLSKLPIDSLAGIRGPPGRDGRDGRDGLPGLGKDGKDGTPGVPGRDGATGLQGPQGDIGAPGVPGSAGPPGVSGKDGSAGTPGTPGRNGTAGQNGRPGLGLIGDVYTRWGRTTCGVNSSIIYTGFAGGSNYNQPGGGVNYQCMPLDPQFNSNGGSSFTGSWITGIEYETYAYGIFPSSAFQQNAPCVRCYTNNRSAVMMIPAKRECSEGWTKEYDGYLMTEYYNHNHQNTFECVDANPEYVSGESQNKNGGLFYFTRIECGKGGHCPPYQSSKELTCVVCSK